MVVKRGWHVENFHAAEDEHDLNHDEPDIRKHVVWPRTEHKL